MSVLGYSSSSRSYVGLRARAIALALVSARYPQPSRMVSTSGLVRDIISFLLLASPVAPMKIGKDATYRLAVTGCYKLFGSEVNFDQYTTESLVLDDVWL